MININQTRLILQESKEGAFNYILQADRSFDRLHWKINEYLASDSVKQKEQLWPELQLRFDVLWSIFRVFDIHLPAKERLESAEIFSDKVKSFLTKSDDIFTAKTLPQNPELESVRQSISLLTTELYGVGNDVFAKFNVFRDNISHRMETLYRYFWIAGVLLFITGTLLVAQLFRLINQSIQLYNEVQKSESRLVTVVKELRSGKREQKEKDSFLAAASHDLRQPLHALGLFVKALESKVTLPDGPPILDKIKQCTDALGSLFDSLLDISRLDAGVIDVKAHHFYCSDLFRSLQEEFEAVAADRNLSYRTLSANEVLHTDYGLLGRILRNLIVNALEYTKVGEVVVSCASEGNSVIVAITDTGIGIPTKEQEAIFSEYYQLDNPERDRSKGLGIGLSIVRRLTELLGIETTITSDIGIGTKFELKIPAGDALKAISLTPTLPIFIAKDLQRATILVIDDEQHVREGMELILDKINCNVVCAESGESARQRLVEQSLTPSLIIADYRLREGKTGIAAVALIRNELNEDIPALIITGDTSPDRVEETSRNGLPLLRKPVKPDELIDIVESLLLE